MSFIKGEPLRELDHYFGEFPSTSFQKRDQNLDVDIYEESNNLIVKINMPGVDSEKINVSVEGSFLQVTGSYDDSEETSKSKKEYYRKEITSGSFYRSVLLPKNVDASNVEVAYEKGILQITMPIMENNRRKSRMNINIKNNNELLTPSS